MTKKYKYEIHLISPSLRRYFVESDVELKDNVINDVMDECFDYVDCDVPNYNNDDCKISYTFKGTWYGEDRHVGVKKLNND